MSEKTSHGLGASAAFAVVRIVAAGLLLWALAPHPYGYYIALRWVTCAVAVYTVIVAAQAELWGWVVAFGAVALLFNPLVPVHLDRGTWSPIDIAVAALFAGSIPFLRGGKGRAQSAS